MRGDQPPKTVFTPCHVLVQRRLVKSVMLVCNDGLSSPISQEIMWTPHGLADMKTINRFAADADIATLGIKK